MMDGNEKAAIFVSKSKGRVADRKADHGKDKSPAVDASGLDQGHCS